MSTYYSEDVIENIRNSSDVVTIISRYVKLKRVGSNYQGLCPFHHEKTPSFNVSPEKQIFKCFGCGKAGNVFHFIMEMSNLSFPEAIVELAQQNGVILPETSYAYENAEKTTSRKTIFELLELAAELFQDNLQSEEGKKAKEYLIKRQINEETIEKFRLGLSLSQPDLLYKKATAKGFSQEEIEQAGLITEKGNQVYDKFRNRVMFPIFDIEGRVIAFGGRVLDENQKPKYLNSPETNLFSKRKTVYALSHARSAIIRSKNAILVEGYTDVLMAHQYGVGETVATLGTALTEQHVKQLKRYADLITLVFDGDTSGQNAMMRSLEVFVRYGIAVKTAVLPKKQDPCDFIAEFGPKEFYKVIEEATDSFDFQIAQIGKKFDLKTTGGKSSALKEFREFLKQIPEDSVRQLVINKISEYFKIPSELLQREFQLQKPVMRQRKPISSYQEKLAYEDEKFLLWVCLHKPEQMERIFLHYSPESFRSLELRQIAEKIFPYKNNPTLNIDSLSSKFDDAQMGKLLVSIYYHSKDDAIEDTDKIFERLNWVLKAVGHHQHRNKFQEVKKALASNGQNDEDKTELLRKARELCRQKHKLRSEKV